MRISEQSPYGVAGLRMLLDESEQLHAVLAQDSSRPRRRARTA